MAEIQVSHAWDPIEDLPADWKRWARPDLDDLLELWDTEKASLKDQAKVERLRERLATLWAIETGIIERLYTVDRGTTETLADLGLEAIQQFSSNGRISPQAVKIIEDQRAALDFVFSYLREERPLSTSYIKELHQLLLAHQTSTEAVDQFGTHFQAELQRGVWKTLPNNPVTSDGSLHEYCPPDFVQDEMDRLIELHLRHMDDGVRPEIEAAWLHHRFTQIHPFQDGNGRVARSLATLVFLKAGFLPLVIRDIEHRESYLRALESADKGDLGPLVSLFSNILSEDLDDAITFVRDIRGQGIREIAVAAASAAKRRIQEDERTLEEFTDALLEIATQRLQEISFELRSAFQEQGLVLDSSVIKNEPENAGWWNQQIISAARQYQYYADFGRFRRWVQLRQTILGSNSPRWHIVVSFHHKEIRTGIMAAIVFLTASEGSEEQREVSLGSDNEFSFSSGARGAAEDFRTWLDTALEKVLQIWQSRV